MARSRSRQFPLSYYQHVLPLPYVPAQHQRAYDSHTGTHLVPPAYALPRAGFDPGDYSTQVREWLAEYEKRYGPRGHSDVTTEKVPLFPDRRLGPGHRREAPDRLHPRVRLAGLPGHPAR